MTVCTTDRPDAPPEPTTYLYDVQCVRCGTWILSTWTGLKRWVKVNGVYVARQYREAKDAPAWVQDAAFIHVERHGGLRMWRGTGCPGTE